MGITVGFSIDDQIKKRRNSASRKKSEHPKKRLQKMSLCEKRPVNRLKNKFLKQKVNVMKKVNQVPGDGGCCGGGRC
jgi:hypothetical protein